MNRLFEDEDVENPVFSPVVPNQLNNTAACSVGNDADEEVAMDDEDETEVLYLRSAPPCPSPANASEVGYNASAGGVLSAQAVVPANVVLVPTVFNRNRLASFDGRVAVINSPMSSRSVSVKTLADADSIVARFVHDFLTVLPL
jgi:hypothetical protein